MRIAGIIAALALAAAPMPGFAETAEDDDERAAATLEPGGVSQGGVLPVFDLNNIPAGAIVIGSVVLLAGVIVGSVLTRDSTVSTTN